MLELLTTDFTPGVRASVSDSRITTAVTSHARLRAGRYAAAPGVNRRSAEQNASQCIVRRINRKSHP